MHLMLAASCGESSGRSADGGLGVAIPPLNWGPASTPVLPSDIVGPWFVCKDPACSGTSNTGFLLQDDGTWVGISAPGSSWDPGERFCEKTGTQYRGTYDWDGLSIVMHLPAGIAVSGVAFLDQARAVLSYEDEMVVLRRVDALSSGPCTEGTPAPLP
jgi:hypothetical protein